MNGEQINEIKDFICLLKKLDTRKKEGLYLLMRGAAVVSGTKNDIYE